MMPFGIYGVAYRFEENGGYFSLPPPNRHHHLFQPMLDIGIDENRIHNIFEQGFVGEGGFLNREDALALAIKNGFDMANKKGNPNMAFSEDFW